MLLRLLLFSPLLFFISCNSSDHTPKEIYGRWVLDSTSVRGGKMIAGGPREHTEFTLASPGSFSYKWSDFDVYGGYNGTFRYIKMKDTLLPLLVFSIRYPEKKDSVIRLDTFVVLALNDSILRTREKESYKLLDSTLKIQNRVNVYRKSNRN